MKTLAEIAATPIAEVERREPVKLAREATLAEVVTELREKNRGSVLVMDGDRLAGIFTERDLMKRVDHGDQAWRATPVGEVMTPEPRTIRLDQTVGDAINLMATGTYRHLPVIEVGGEVAGIVSIRDLLVHVVGFFPDDFINLPRDPEHEATEPWGG
jgi:CBS domain-containing protein